MSNRYFSDILLVAMILTRNEIIKSIEKKFLLIEPLNKEAIEPASIDLTLDNEIRVFDKVNQSILVVEEADHLKITKKITFEKYFMRPGACLGDNERNNNQNL